MTLAEQMNRLRVWSQYVAHHPVNEDTLLLANDVASICDGIEKLVFTLKNKIGFTCECIRGANCKSCAEIRAQLSEWGML